MKELSSDRCHWAQKGVKERVTVLRGLIPRLPEEGSVDSGSPRDWRGEVDVWGTLEKNEGGIYAFERWEGFGGLGERQMCGPWLCLTVVSQLSCPVH